MSNEKNHDFPNLWQAIFVLALLFGLEILIATSFYDAGVRFEPGDVRYGSIVAVLGFGITLSLLMGYKNIGYRSLFHPVAKRVTDVIRPIIIPLILFTVGFVLVAPEISRLIIGLFPMSQSDIEMFERMYTGGIATTITLCLIAPFIEEMLFRGVFLRSFIPTYGWVKSILYSSLLFGLFHMNIYQFVIATILGLISGWLYVSTKSLWPSIIEHAAYNTGVVIYYYIVTGVQGTGADDLYQPPLGLTLIGLVAILCGGLWLWQTTRSFQESY